MFAHRLERRHRADARHDDGADALAHDFVAITGHGAFEHVRHLRQHRVEFLGCNLDAAANDDLLEPSDEAIEAQRRPSSPHSSNRSPVRNQPSAVNDCAVIAGARK